MAVRGSIPKLLLLGAIMSRARCSHSPYTVFISLIELTQKPQSSLCLLKDNERDTPIEIGSPCDKYLTATYTVLPKTFI